MILVLFPALVGTQCPLPIFAPFDMAASLQTDKGKVDRASR
jgi:hypothetical protein